MNAADTYRYSNRADIDRQIEAMKERIFEERREEIGRWAARQEARQAVYAFHKAEYNRIEDEVTAQWGIHA